MAAAFGSANHCDGNCLSFDALSFQKAVSFLAGELEFASVQPRSLTILGREVFIVHGHDEAALHAVARLLGQLGFEFIILREQPSQGRTIIEKLEDCAEEVGFAVVIMRP